MGEPTVRDQFLEQACEAWNNALDDAIERAYGMSTSSARHRWADMSMEQREVAAAAMGKFLDWLDSRRF